MTSTPTRPVDNVVITTKGLQYRNINILAGTTVENKGKLILIDKRMLNVRKMNILRKLHGPVKGNVIRRVARNEELPV